MGSLESQPKRVAGIHAPRRRRRRHRRLLSKNSITFSLVKSTCANRWTRSPPNPFLARIDPMPLRLPGIWERHCRDRGSSARAIASAFAPASSRTCIIRIRTSFSRLLYVKQVSAAATGEQAISRPTANSLRQGCRSSERIRKPRTRRTDVPMMKRPAQTAIG